MKRALSFKLWEKYDDMPGLRVPRQLDLIKDEIDAVKKISWRDIDWETIGNDGSNIVWLELKIPLDLNIKDGVVVDIQLINKMLYQVHISLAEDLRGIGLGTKIYRSLVEWAGHLYSGKGRRLNPIIDKVWDRLKLDSRLECESSDFGDICVSPNNPNKERLLSIFKK